jgi:hypothetical protein
MKKLLLALPLLALTSIGAHAQGTVVFANFLQDFSIEKKILDSVSGLPVGGTYQAQLFAGAAGTAEGSLTAVDIPQGLFDLPLDPYGNYYGEFFGGEVAISGVAAGATAQLQIRVWPTVYATWTQAYNAALNDANIHVGKSASFQNITGNPGDNIEIAGNAGFIVFTVGPIPEPSTLALGALGLGMILLRRRK